MSDDLLALLEEMDDEPHVREESITKALFSYPGGKARCRRYITPHLPQRSAYIEPFGGSAAILLARKKSRLEVYNDRYGGVVDFYRCVRDPDLLNQLCERLELTVHAREEFQYCKQTWAQPEMIVERAARWYYMTIYSFGSQGRNFGRATAPACTFAGKIQKRLKHFAAVHERMRNVQVENQDWKNCMLDYDQHDGVFYCDPPYLDTSPGIYKNDLTPDDHVRFMDLVHSMKGFVAVSSYPNKLYDSYEWDYYYEWDHYESTTSLAHTESNNKADLVQERSKVKEALYIKEAV